MPLICVAEISARAEGRPPTHDPAVTSVQMLQEEENLTASDMAATTKLWDLRPTKCVKQHEGHVNEYACLPLRVHEEEEWR